MPNRREGVGFVGAKKKKKGSGPLTRQHGSGCLAISGRVRCSASSTMRRGKGNEPVDGCLAGGAGHSTTLPSTVVIAPT